ncbi:MAG: hypothetical protein M1826_001735 [Phylliscum demangeonii]|nr:MAG: hypothetical protein M1826_001735 [Phylliscum demangeonii]
MKSLIVLSLALNALAATVHLDWSIGWVTADPDKTGHTRRVIGVNGKWPPPQIDVNVGDLLEVAVHNNLGDWNTTLHWHGIYQQGTNNYDGPEYVTQCPIPPKSSMLYKFPINQVGTYWWHSHVSGQYPDGLRGPLIVHDPKVPFKYDHEIVLTVSDWYYDEIRKLIPRFLNKANTNGQEPFPNATLINETVLPKITVLPNKTYLVRAVNIGAFLTYTLWFQDHDFQIVEVDGIYTNPALAQQINIAPAQRYSFLLKTKSTATTNYPFVAFLNNVASFGGVPAGFKDKALGWLVYNPSGPLPSAKSVAYSPFDDYTLKPTDNLARYRAPDRTIILNVSFNPDRTGITRAYFNSTTYQAPKIPTLFTALNAVQPAVDRPSTYGLQTDPFVFKKGEVIDIILNDHDSGPHPFHLHGHAFQLLYRSPPNAGDYKGSSHLTYPAVPMRRDTACINPMGFMVLRYTADNPGIWLFHCHIEWHILQGLTATILEAPELLNGLLTIPQDQRDICAAAGIDISPYSIAAFGTTAINGLAAPDTPPLVVRRRRARSLEPETAALTLDAR